MTKPPDFDQSASSRITPELWRVKPFCDAYGIGLSSFYREVAAGRLKVVKYGAATRIRRADAEAWLAQLPVVGGERDEAA